MDLELVVSQGRNKWGQHVGDEWREQNKDKKQNKTKQQNTKHNPWS